ncbi:MAG: ABC transporter substrate-binding protein [Polaromonas sp.]|nr:ABC transporter substrate-binding protein [Polaromonas sp.]
MRINDACEKETMQTNLAEGAGTAEPHHAGLLQVFGNLDTLEFAPVLLAGATREAGRMDITHGGILSLYGQASDLPNLKTRGRSHAATNSETQALRYSVANPDLRIIFTVAEGVYRIVARRSAGIGKLSDLRGKRVGTMPRTSSAYYLHRCLSRAGIRDDEVTVVPFVSGTDRPLAMMKDALCGGHIDAVTIWEPEMQRCADALGADAVSLFEAADYREQFSLMSTEANLNDPVLRPRIVELVRSLVIASEQIRRDPRDALQLVATAARMDAKIIERAWPHNTYPGTLLGTLLDTLVEEDVWVARETGRVPRNRSQLAPLVDYSVLDEALRTPVSNRA